MTPESFRLHFPICRKGAYFASCSKGALCDRTRLAIEHFLQSWETLGAPWEEQWVGKTELARRLFARLIGADADEIAIFSSVSAALSAVASAFHRDSLPDFSGRDTLLIDRTNFPTISHVWMLRASQGLRVNLLPVGRRGVTTDLFERHLDRKSLGVMLSHIHYTTGARCDLGALAALAHAHGALAMVDDSQVVGTEPIDVKALDLDVLVTAGSKYLCAPPGIAFLYVKRSLIQRLRPTVGGWFGHRKLMARLEDRGGEIVAHPDPRIWSALAFQYAPTARRFEQGTPEVVAAAGAAAALELLLEAGLDRIAAHNRRLAADLARGLDALGARIKTPMEPERRGPLMVLRTPRPQALCDKLLEEGIFTSPRGEDGLRFALHLYNSKEDIDRVLDVVARNRDLL